MGVGIGDTSAQIELNNHVETKAHAEEKALLESLEKNNTSPSTSRGTEICSSLKSNRKKRITATARSGNGGRRRNRSVRTGN